MRFSVIFLAAFLGSAAATTASENHERDFEEISERDLSGDAGPALEERRFLFRPLGGGPARLPTMAHMSKIRPGVKRRPRDIEERDLEERALLNHPLSFNRFRPSPVRRPMRRPRDIEERDIEERALIHNPFSPNRLRPSPMRRPTRRPRDIEERDLEERRLLTPSFGGGRPKLIPLAHVQNAKKRLGSKLRLRDVDERDLEERMFTTMMNNRRPIGWKGASPVRSKLSHPGKSGSRSSGHAGAKRRPRDIDESGVEA